MLIKTNSKDSQKVESPYKTYITMTKEVHDEMFGYVEAFDTECSGCGIVERIEHKEGDVTEVEFKVTEIFLPNQKNSAAATDIEAEEITKLVTELVIQGRDADVEKLRFHWHSHVNMSVFHSSTDEENYEDLRTGPYLVSIVANKKKELLGRVDYYEPVRLSIVEVPVYVRILTDVRIPARVKENMARVAEYQKNLTPAPIGFGGKVSYKNGKKFKLFDHAGNDITDDYDGYPGAQGGYTPAYAQPGTPTESFGESQTFFDNLTDLEAKFVNMEFLKDEKGVFYGIRDYETAKCYEFAMWEIEDPDDIKRRQGESTQWPPDLTLGGGYNG